MQEPLNFSTDTVTIVSWVTFNTSTNNLNDMTSNPCGSSYNEQRTEPRNHQHDIYYPNTGGYILSVLTPFIVLICLTVIIISISKNCTILFKWKQVQRSVIIYASLDLFYYISINAFALHVTFTLLVPPTPLCTLYASLLYYF